MRHLGRPEPSRAPRVIDIRAPIELRVGAAGLLLAGATWALVELGSEPASLLAASRVNSPLVYLIWRIATARLYTDGEEFVVRNYIRTHRIPIERVDRFDVGGGYYGVDLRLRSSFEKVTVNVIQEQQLDDHAWKSRTSRRARRRVERLLELRRASG